MKKLFLYSILPLSLLVIFYFVLRNDQTKSIPEIHGIYLQKPQAIMPFALTQTDGQSFTDQKFQGHWTLVFFGFTYCPDICPTTLAMMNNVVEKLDPKPQVVFVSVDPERDNLAQLDKYIHYFNPNFIGITGDLTQLKSFARQLGVVFDKVSTNKKRPKEYLMEHSTSIALINPRGAIQAIFTAPHQVDDLVTDITHVMH